MQASALLKCELKAVLTASFQQRELQLREQNEGLVRLQVQMDTAAEHLHHIGRGSVFFFFFSSMCVRDPQRMKERPSRKREIPFFDH